MIHTEGEEFQQLFTDYPIVRGVCYQRCES
jgi:hypothetical protein